MWGKFQTFDRVLYVVSCALLACQDLGAFGRLSNLIFSEGVEQHYDLSLTIILYRSKRTSVPKVA
jgi:hypothetical protein